MITFNTKPQNWREDLNAVGPMNKLNNREITSHTLRKQAKEFYVVPLFKSTYYVFLEKRKGNVKQSVGKALEQPNTQDCFCFHENNFSRRQ